MKLHPDFRDFLSVLASEAVEALVIGGYAVSFHSKPRFTKDIDILVGSTPANRGRLARSLERFGAPTEIVEAATAAAEDEILWFGVPPTRIDLLFTAPGIEFAEAYARREQTEWDGVRVSVITKVDLIAAKRAAGRDQDLRDAEQLSKT
jgi:uncharacterized nucleotidyltransferase DUF6036